MYYAGLKKYSIGNGEGVRVSLYVSGCTFHCEGCFNQETWDFDYGNKFTEETYQEIVSLLQQEGISGLSLLGGDPLCQADEDIQILINLCKEAHKLNKTVWMWSGFTWEEMWNSQEKVKQELITNCDVWADGPFVLALRDLRLQWCGSSNQRIIDVQKSLSEQKIILYKSNFTK